jgi:hypothetical protein
LLQDASSKKLKNTMAAKGVNFVMVSIVLIAYSGQFSASPVCLMFPDVLLLLISSRFFIDSFLK